MQNPHDSKASAWRSCDFCGESIQAVAKKCRHCGEYLDSALRSAEEAKRIALGSHRATPIVVNNSSAASAAASATAISGFGRHRSLLGRLVLAFLGSIALILAGLRIGMDESVNEFVMTIGLLMTLAGLAGLFVGVPILMIRVVWRWVFG